MAMKSKIALSQPLVLNKWAQLSIELIPYVNISLNSNYSLQAEWKKKDSSNRPQNFWNKSCADAVDFVLLLKHINILNYRINASITQERR